MTTWIPITALLMILSRSAAAQPTSQTVQVAVNGPAGALLRMDGQAMGTLPLGVNLVVPAGPHRFQLELANNQRESDTLILPANRRAELNLSLSDNALVAVLLTTPELNAALLPVVPHQRPRPVWRLVTGSLLVGSGLLLGGFGSSALLINGACQAQVQAQGNTDASSTCSPYYNTSVIGAELWGVGGPLAVAGALLLAIPSPR